MSGSSYAEAHGALSRVIKGIVVFDNKNQQCVNVALRVKGERG